MPQKSLTIHEKKVTLYNRSGISIWHARIKLETGEWWRFSTKQTDFEEAKEVALKSIKRPNINIKTISPIAPLSLSQLLVSSLKEWKMNYMLWTLNRHPNILSFRSSFW